MAFISFRGRLTKVLAGITRRKKGSMGGGGLTRPQDPKFVSSHPVEVDVFFQGVKILSSSPPREASSRGF